MSQVSTDAVEDRPSHAHIAGDVAGHPACAVCTHVHRVTATNAPREVTYDAACGCGCKASGDIYDHGDITADVAAFLDGYAQWQSKWNEAMADFSRGVR